MHPLLVLVLALCAWEDYKKREIPTALVGLAYMFAFFSGVGRVVLPWLGFLLFAYSLSHRFVELGDALLLPIFLASLPLNKQLAFWLSMWLLWAADNFLLKTEDEAPLIAYAFLPWLVLRFV